MSILVLDIVAAVFGFIGFGMAFNTGLSPKESDKMLALSFIPMILAGLCVYLSVHWG